MRHGLVVIVLISIWGGPITLIVTSLDANGQTDMVDVLEVGTRCFDIFRNGIVLRLKKSKEFRSGGDFVVGRETGWGLEWETGAR